LILLSVNSKFSSMTLPEKATSTPPSVNPFSLI
jgi:hypothetical protein